MAKYDIALQILANSAPLKAAMKEAGSNVRRLAIDAKRHFDSFRGALGTVQGKLAAVGLSFGAVRIAAESARIDHTLTRVRLAAGATAQQAAQHRTHLAILAEQTGQTTEALGGSFDALVQSGMKWDEARLALDGVSAAMVINGGTAQQYADMLDLVGKAFDVDFSKAGTATSTLERLTVASRIGDAKLNVLPGILGRIGLSAKTAGLGMGQTVAMVEALYKLTPGSPERLARLMDSTLQVFADPAKMRKIQQQSGGRIRFFDQAGARRDALAVLGDVKTQFDAFSTESQKMGFLGNLFGAGPETRGIYAMLSGDMLKTAAEFQDKMDQAGGTFRKDLPAALDDAAAQGARLRSILTNTALEFAKPINEAIANAIQWATNKPSEGGMGLGGKSLIGMGAGLAFVTAVTGKRIGGWAGSMLGGAASTATGVAAGKALQQTAGVTPVFVTNWPASMGPAGAAGAVPGLAGALPGLAGVGAGGAGAAAKGVGMAGLSVALAPAAIGLAAGFLVNRLIVGAGMVNAALISNDIDKRLREAGFRAETNINVVAPPGTRVEAQTRASGGESRTNVRHASRGPLGMPPS